MLFGIGVYKFKEIRLLFSSDGRSKLIRLEKKITEEFKKNELSEDTIKDYSKASGSFFSIDITNPEAFYFLALSNFYETHLMGSDIKLSQIPYACINGKSTLLPESRNFDKTFGKMYIEAKRAKAFGLNNEFSESNNLLILYYETFHSSKKNEILSKEFLIINKNNISKNLTNLYKKLGLLIACLSGNTNLNNTILEEHISSGQSEISEDEINFLKSLTFYNANEYVKSLEFLRNIQSSINPSLLKEGKILEAMIFFKQNLHEKAIDILEKLYESTDKKDSEILNKIQTIVNSKKGLKSKLVKE
ncbi:MAG: hypothetical protein L6Q54_01745 [Leptospiraceae bacterium]|nr:hypothetical protein [Leptospiraceae bacterium]NUM40078.1 hypothetical protein [Leptospiraceae bacterium]